MTIKQAIALHELASGDDIDRAYTPSEQLDIHQEIEAIVAAKSDRSAARIILWWNCWDRNHTATAFCRRVREAYRKGLHKQ